MKLPVKITKKNLKPVLHAHLQGQEAVIQIERDFSYDFLYVTGKIDLEKFSLISKYLYQIFLAYNFKIIH